MLQFRRRAAFGRTCGLADKGFHTHPESPRVTAIYQTQVAVVLIEPLAINLPKLQVGEELTREIVVPSD